MTLQTNLSEGFAHIIDKAGRQIKIEYLTPIYDDTYDEAIDSVISGTLWTSGIVLQPNNSRGTSDSVLMEQGKVIDSDKKLYVNGSLVITGSEYLTKIQIGSPTGEVYTTIPDGATMHEVNGTPIYKKIFIRRLTTGSLFSG